MRVSQSLRLWGLALVVSLVAACGSNGASDTPDSSNLPPTASLRVAGNVPVTALVTLDASGSVANGGRTLAYSWTLLSKPSGSTATISNPTTVQPTFTADVAGTYSFMLTVIDGTLSSHVNNSTNAIASSQAITSDVVEPLSGTVKLGLAFDPAIVTVDWLVDGAQIGTGAITQVFDTTTVANGNHVVTARLNFTANEYVFSLSRTFAVAQTTVSFTGATASGTGGAFTAITGAQSVNGIVHVDATLDGVAIGTLTAPNACLDSTGAACATTGPNGYQFTGTQVAGAHVIVFTATDGGGNHLSIQAPFTGT